MFDTKKDANDNSLTFDEKIEHAVITAISNLETTSTEEQLKKLEYSINMHHILSNYEDLRPILTKFFKDKNRSTF